MLAIFIIRFMFDVDAIVVVVVVITVCKTMLESIYPGFNDRRPARRRRGTDEVAQTDYAGFVHRRSKYQR